MIIIKIWRDNGSSSSFLWFSFQIILESVLNNFKDAINYFLVKQFCAKFKCDVYRLHILPYLVEYWKVLLSYYILNNYETSQFLRGWNVNLFFKYILKVWDLCIKNRFYHNFNFNKMHMIKIKLMISVQLRKRMSKVLLHFYISVSKLKNRIR